MKCCHNIACVLLGLFLSLFTISTGFAAPTQDEFEVITGEGNKVIALQPKTKIRSAVSGDLVLSSDVILSKLSKGSDLFVADVGTELKPVATNTDAFGTRVVYAQLYNGIEVFGSQVSVYFNNDGELTFIKGETAKGITADTNLKFSAAQAKEVTRKDITFSHEYRKAKRVYKATERRRCGRRIQAEANVSRCISSKIRKFNLVNRPLVKFAPQLFVNPASSGQADIVWKFTQANLTTGDEVYEVSANDGTILSKKSDINLATPPTRQVLDCGHSFANPDLCYLNYFTTAPGKEFILGRSEGQPERGANPFSGFHNSTDVDKMYSNDLPLIHQFYENKFNRSGANTFGGTVRPTATGNNTRARFLANPHKVPSGGPTSCGPYGDQVGGWSTPEAVSLCHNSHFNDLIAHEYSHLAVRNLIIRADWNVYGLDSYGEPGSFNESLGDIMGQSFEYYMTDYTDWVMLPEVGSQSRSLENPGIGSYVPVSTGSPVPRPDRFNSPNFYCGQENSAGIHFNSTVPSKAFYLMSQGGSFNGCNINGIGILKAEQIWYRGVFRYFSNIENFNVGVVSMGRACQDFVDHPEYLAGKTPPIVITVDDCIQVKKALQATEMDLPRPCVDGVTVPHNIPPNCRETVQPIAGDVNGDRLVNLEDLHAILLKWGLNAEGAPEDLNGNALVDIADYNIWYGAYYVPNGGGELPSAPRAAPTLPGDCNGDGSVDGSDFMIWQRSFGATGPALICDSNLDRIVDSADLEICKSNFGNSI